MRQGHIVVDVRITDGGPPDFGTRKELANRVIACVNGLTIPSLTPANDNGTFNMHVYRVEFATYAEFDAADFPGDLVAAYVSRQSVGGYSAPSFVNGWMVGRTLIEFAPPSLLCLSTEGYAANTCQSGIMSGTIRVDALPLGEGDAAYSNYKNILYSPDPSFPFADSDPRHRPACCNFAP
jgi:hypothetical protein